MAEHSVNWMSRLGMLARRYLVTMIVDRTRARAFGPPSREDGWDGSSGHDSKIVQLVSLRRNVPLRLPALRMGRDRHLIMIAGRRGLGTAGAGSSEEVVLKGGVLEEVNYLDNLGRARSFAVALNRICARSST